MLPLSTLMWHIRFMTKRKPYHHGDLRAALLGASLDLLRGPRSGEFTLREVARRAGVSHTAPYRHFRDKADLLAAVAEDGFERLTAAMKFAAGKAQQPFRRLQNAGIAYVEFAQAQPEHFSVMFTVDLTEGHALAKAAADRCFAELVTLVEACREARSENGEPLEISARIAWSQVHGIAELARHGQLRFRTQSEQQQFVKLATESIGRGLRLV